MNDYKAPKKIIGKPNIFVVLEEGLLFLSDGAKVALEDRFLAEPVKELVTV
uniref:Uncharacterized protein n=1 Tax=viral metagenome TaxID=1070528 RepID=A0A6M3LB81_9ZZZZ